MADVDTSTDADVDVDVDADTSMDVDVVDTMSTDMDMSTDADGCCITQKISTTLKRESRSIIYGSLFPLTLSSASRTRHLVRIGAK